MPILRILKDGILLQELAIQNALITIGRGPENDVRLADLTVSRQHCQLKRHANDRYLIEDLRSRNGTKLNGHRLSAPVILTDGDKLAIGVYEIIFRDPVEVTQLRRTHEVTTSVKAFSAAGKIDATTAPLSSSQLPEGNRESGEAMLEQSDQPLEIGILVNEANNAIFAIDRDKVLLGSDDDVDIRVPGPPRTRASIAHRGKFFYICSETPTPCVSVNGRPVMNAQLIFNDRIEIGGRRFIFRDI
jgi:predicted component of type VI protein secretion system